MREFPSAGFVRVVWENSVREAPAKLLDVIALLDNQPALELVPGQVGTIVEVMAPGVFEVESRPSF